MYDGLDWLCGNSTTFYVWKNHDFGLCFWRLTLDIPINALLMILSVYYLGKNNGKEISATFPCSPTLHSRFYISISFVIFPIIDICLQQFYFHINVENILIISTVINCISWIFHSILVWKLRKYYHISISGPILLIIVLIFICAKFAFKLRSVLVNAEMYSKSETYLTYVEIGLVSAYMLTLLPCQRPVFSSGIEIRPINDYRESLISGEDDSISTITPTVILEGSILPLEAAEENASFFNKLIFQWVQTIMVRGSLKRINNANDLYKLPNRLKAENIIEKFQNVSYYYEKDDIYNTLIKYRSLLSTLNKAFGKEYYLLGILKFLADILGFLGPLLLNLIVKFIENKNEPRWYGYIYALGLFLTTLLTTFFTSHFDYNVQVIALKMRAALISSVYSKPLKTSNSRLTTFSTGQIVNYMSTDVDRIINFCSSFHQFWSLPFQVGVSLWLLYLQIGYSFLAGLGFAIILIPINRYLAIAIGKLSNSMMDQKDIRVKLMTEILRGIRVIKFYAWENIYTDKIGNIRQEELKKLKGRKYLDAFCVYFWATTPVLISILTFTTYVLLGNNLTAAKVFTSLALLNMLISPLNAFPWVINGLMESWVSLKRVQKFFKVKDVDWEAHFQNLTENPDNAIEINQASFSWRIDSQESSNFLKLENITFNVKFGEFIGITGPVGSGKSSLFLAIIGEMYNTHGEIRFSPSFDAISFQPQEAWIQHGTIEENILFGEPMDCRFYHRVLDACALLPDLNMFENGDQTEIGENGVTLSGGQKARICLARAVYQNKNIIFLDDPFAAVDSQVAQHIYTQCILRLLFGKTIILCTHHTKFLKDANKIIVLKNGKIDKIGKPSELLKNLKDLGNQTSSEKSSINKLDVEDKNENQTQNNEELKENGVVRFSIYLKYCKAIGLCLAISILISMLLMQGSKNANDWWLSYWVSHSMEVNNKTANISELSLKIIFLTSSIPHEFYKTSCIYSINPHLKNHDSEEPNIKFYLMVYGLLAGANTIFTLFRAFLFAYGGIQAAKKLHDKLLNAILYARLTFFDTTPVGRIINRFSSDIYGIDDSLPFILNIFLSQIFTLVGTLIITCYGLPWFAIVLLPIGSVYYAIQNYYRNTSREIKRISSITLSPIYAHFSESLTGLVMIRAMRHVKRFEVENRSRLDINQRGRLAEIAVSVWLGFRLQLLGVAMLTSVALIAVFQHHSGGSIQPGLFGLALSYALSITNILSGAVTAFTVTEKELVAVERACQYIDSTSSEFVENNHFDNLSINWSNACSIRFENVSAYYRDGLGDCLRNLDFNIKPGENVGVVGRTGAGKSSIFMAIYRLLNIRSGRILIGDLDISKLDLYQFRRSLSIIPQDPFLFSTSIRENIDPLNRYNDAKIWSALSRCRIDNLIRRLGGLEANVGEGGKNMSVGERQLLCLTRAMLSESKILCIDEATASVDSDTDNLIHSTIRTEFKNQTILTIAHRIRTVIDCDRVMVLDNGSIKEFDKPSVLEVNRKSAFYSLLNNRHMSEVL